MINYFNEEIERQVRQESEERKAILEKAPKLPYSVSIPDEETLQHECDEQDRIIAELNKGDTVQVEEREVCERGEHYILINEFALPQCATCLTLFDTRKMWHAVRHELDHTNWSDEMKVRRFQELKLIARLVSRGTPPSNVVNWNDNRYLQGRGYRYIERTFYEID